MGDGRGLFWCWSKSIYIYICKLVQEIQVCCESMVVLKLSGDMFGCDRDVLYMSTNVPLSESPFCDQAETQCSHITVVDICISDLWIALEIFM